MISNLCKCCFFVEQTKEVLEATANDEEENILEVQKIKDVQIVSEVAKDHELIPDLERQLSLETEKLKFQSSELEEDSGTCSDLQEQVQLTVSSVNSILPDLPEEDQDLPLKDEDSGTGAPLTINQDADRIIPLVIIAAEKQQNSSSQQRTIKPNLKKPKYARQCSAPGSSSSSSALLPSENSSRRDSFETNVNGKKPREKSPCVSFDADVTIVDQDQVPKMRSRSRSDASNRFKGKMAWLRDRQISKAAIKEDSSEMESFNVKSGAHRPRTRSDSKWLKINRKNRIERETNFFVDKLRKISNIGTTNTKSEMIDESRLTKSQSLAGLTNHEVDKVMKLKRRSSERDRSASGSNAKKSVAFDQNRSSWWNTSMKYLFEIGNKGKSSKRRRHLSSDARNSILKSM